MNSKFLVCLLTMLPFFALCTLAQDQSTNPESKPSTVKKRKQLQAVRIETPPIIDGVFDELVWQNAPIATDFIQANPDPGTAPSLQTDVKVLYDNTAIYIGVMCHDDLPGDI